MELAWAAVGVAAGVPAGAALRGTVFRLSVPPGDPPRTACPRCAGQVPRWLPLRCRSCRSRLGSPLVLELATAAVLALLLGRFGGQPDMVAFCYLGALGVSLAAIDLSVHRLPDALTLPAYPVLIILLALAALAGHHAGALVRALAGCVVLAAAYLVLALLRPGQLGGGDIKLAGLAGLALGWLGWPVLLAGLAGPAGRGRPRLRALRRGQPGTAGRAADHAAQPDLLRAVPARRCPARGARHRLTVWRSRPGRPCQPAARLARQRGAAMPWSHGREVTGHGTLLRDNR
jgi:leader peptidase (prepilin peptidase)/N-methyltransferase